MTRFIRPLINILLSIGYLFGLCLAWIGLETMTIERGELSRGIFITACGIILWALLNILGRRLSRLYFRGHATREQS
jgi:hypothetical protein